MFEIIKIWLKYKSPKRALFINGAWGKGKTYYIKNVLKEELKKDKDYTLVHTSLFGIKSQSQLINRVITDILLSLGSGQPGSKLDLIIHEIKKSQDLLNYFDEYGHIQLFFQLNKDLVTNLIICFDDFERISIADGFDHQEVLACINANFIELWDVNVIIVGNMNEIKEDDSLVLKKTFEKVVCKTIEFINDTEDIWGDIIKEYSLKNSDYYFFLLKHKFDLCLLADKLKYENLRSIINFVNELRYVYEHSNEIIKGLELEVIFFMLVFSYEKRSGRILESKWFVEDIQMRVSFGSTNEDENLRSELAQAFKELTNLRPNVQYETFPSLFEFIHNGNFDYGKLEAEIKSIDNRRNPKGVSDFDKKIFRLYNFYQIKNEDFIVLLDDVKENFPKQKVGLKKYVEYFFVFAFLLDKNVLGMDKKELVMLMLEHLGHFKQYTEKEDIILLRTDQELLDKIEDFDSELHHKVKSSLFEEEERLVRLETEDIFNHFYTERFDPIHLVSVLESVDSDRIAERILKLFKEEDWVNIQNLSNIIKINRMNNIDSSQINEIINNMDGILGILGNNVEEFDRSDKPVSKYWFSVLREVFGSKVKSLKEKMVRFNL